MNAGIGYNKKYGTGMIARAQMVSKILGLHASIVAASIN
jgi:hypothetical protein